jgi:hypothetical protein
MAQKIATEKKHERKGKSVKVRAGVQTSTAVIKVTSVYHCAKSGFDGFC